MAGIKRGRTRCTAIKQNGQRCEAYAPVGETLCRYHQDPHQKDGNSLAAIHGATAKKLLTDQEFAIYEFMKAECLKMLGGEVIGIDEANLDTLAMSAAKRNTAMLVGNARYAKDHENSMNAAAKRLGILREIREAGNRLPAGPQNIIAMILGNGQPQQVGSASGRALPIPDNAPVFDAEVVEDDENVDLTSHNTDDPKNGNEQKQ